MDEYISKEAVLNLIEHNDKVCHYADERYENVVYATAQTICQVVAEMPSADVQPVNQWISVKERLPEIEKSVLIYYPKWDGDEIQVAKLEGDGMMFDICGEFNIGTGVITHWMPLPEPPKDGDAE